MEMPDVRPLHHVVMTTSTTIVDSVRPADLDADTPCAGWRLADLLAHMTVQNRGFAAAARGFGDSADVWRADAVVDAISANPRDTYAASVDDVVTAFAGDGVLEASFALPEFGPGAVFPGVMAIGFHFIDYVVHNWDVAASLGLPYDVPDEIADTALALSLQVPDGELRDAPGAPFAHAIDAPCTATIDRILRHLGRDPGWAKKTSSLR
ncbi:TIGR03086 family metal-binding protein [Mycolicibacterium sp. P9-64]|uniref:TIGR03086 family metal-binding protein n=1 Tax=Mycolicibacterium sp. P9-64 TaxID=2024612 RepID=UPI00156494A3|nr:TIGR03086 family metal-binding protein [Mycolicibacterium sp. P9-64]